MASTPVADLVGRVLADRYRLLRVVGAGGSGHVYVADDVRLRRRVAVKVLHAALADDTRFLRRFRTEAQLAASLHHPNVMAVYDWGQDGVPFMVLELLEGGSLRGLLDAGELLTPAQAVHVGREVCAALDYAHVRGLVHRDIKPANLLFDEHGIVRVADFGLARALAEASWTEPASSVLGTARYAAPEQGRGRALDGRADLYALALVLVEAVTGRVPFVGDSPLGTLAARERRPIRAPAELGALGAVVERAGRPDPADRYPDAATMADALDDAARALPRPGPLPLVGLEEGLEDPDPTRLPPPPRIFDQDAPAAPAPVVTTRPAPRAPEARRGPWPAMVVAVVLVVVLAAAAFALTRPSTGSPTVVPNLVGHDVVEARTVASRAGLLVATREVAADDPAGLVIAQGPRSGEFLGRGGTIRLTVSKGPKPLPLPPVLGKPVADATRALQAAGLVVDAGQHRYDDTVPKGAVVATDPSGKAPPDSTVKLTVSDGPTPVAVPDVSGQPLDAAAATLQARRFGVQRAPDEFSDTVPAGSVVRTVPPAGQKAQPGTAVQVVVSKGPDLVVVGDFRTLTIDRATALAQAGGLQVTVSGAYSPGKPVVAQSPPPNTQVHRGSTVTLFF